MKLNGVSGSTTVRSMERHDVVWHAMGPHGKSDGISTEIAIFEYAVADSIECRGRFHGVQRYSP